MDDFDPRVHRIVVRSTEDRQEYHVSLPTIAQELDELDNTEVDALRGRIEALEAAPQALVPVEPPKLPAEADQKIEFMVRQVENLREQVGALQDRIDNQQLTAKDANDLTKAINSRMRDMIEGQITDALSELNLRVEKVERGAPGNLANDLDRVSKILAETGRLVADLHIKGSDLEQRHHEFSEELNRIRGEFNGKLASGLREVVTALEGSDA